jgi:hypothetical protein
MTQAILLLDIIPREIKTYVHSSIIHKKLKR